MPAGAAHDSVDLIVEAYDETPVAIPGRWGGNPVPPAPLAAHDAGLTGTFDFVLRSVKMVADAVESRDRAPDSIVPWSYTLLSSSSAGGTTRVVLGTPTLSPARPAAGKPVTLRVPVRSAKGGAPLTKETATCTAQVRGRTIRGRGSTASGWATCRLVVPNGWSKATARGSITVGSGANAVTKGFSFRIV